MNPEQLDHLLGAAGEVTGHRRFVLVGSNAILAWRSAVPEAMSISREPDLYAADVTPEEVDRLSDLLENIGQLSTFDDTYGYYVDGVGPQTAVLPPDWRERSKIYSSPATGGVIAVVPHPDDIALSKLCAGRDKDLDWVMAANEAGLLGLDDITARVPTLPNITAHKRDHILGILERLRRAPLGS